MAHEFGLTTEENNRLDARLAAIREAHDATHKIPRTHPTPPVQEKELTFVDVAIQGLSAFWDNFGRLFSSSVLNPRVNPSHEGTVEMCIIHDDEREEWIKVINTNDMEELALMSGGEVTASSSVGLQQRTRTTPHHALPRPLQLPYSPHHRKRTFKRSMSEDYISSYQAETRREVDLLMEQAADEVTANLSLPMPPFSQVC